MNRNSCANGQKRAHSQIALRRHDCSYLSHEHRRHAPLVEFASLGWGGMRFPRDYPRAFFRLTAQLQAIIDWVGACEKRQGRNLVTLILKCFIKWQLIRSVDTFEEKLFIAIVLWCHVKWLYPPRTQCCIFAVAEHRNDHISYARSRNTVKPTNTGAGYK